MLDAAAVALQVALTDLTGRYGMNSRADQRSRKGGQLALVFAAHFLLIAVLCAGSIIFKAPGPSFASLLFQGLLIAQTCLFAIWFALSRLNAWLRVTGIVAGMGGLLLLRLASNPMGFPLGEQIGLGIELFVVPPFGVAVVMLMLPLMVLQTETTDSSNSDVKPRVSLLGMLTIITVVAIMLGLPPAAQYLSGYDRLSVYIVTQTMALSVISYSSVWTALSGGSPWPRVAVFAAIVTGVALFVGQYSGAIFRYAFGLMQAVTILLAGIIVLLSLLFVRRAGVRCQPEGGSTRRVLLRAALAAIVAIAGIGVLDFLYGRTVITSKPFVAQTTIDDPSGDMRRTAMKEFLRSASAAKLTQLLRLNGDGSTVVDELAGLTGGSGSHELIESNGHDYIVAVGRKAAGRPPGLREQMARGRSSDWMVQYTTASFFNADGRLLGKLGGQLASDKLNGDDVWLTTLGTHDRWFARVSRFEPRGSFTYQTEICLVEPGFPTAFLVYHFPNSTAWTDTPEQSEGGSLFIFCGVPSGATLPNNAKGLGRDGKSYLPNITWDSDRGVFSGPAQLTYQGQPCFEIDLNRSARFSAIDRGTKEKPK